MATKRFVARMDALERPWDWSLWDDDAYTRKTQAVVATSIGKGQAWALAEKANLLVNPRVLSLSELAFLLGQGNANVLNGMPVTERQWDGNDTLYLHTHLGVLPVNKQCGLFVQPDGNITILRMLDGTHAWQVEHHLLTILKLEKVDPLTTLAGRKSDAEFCAEFKAEA